MTGALSVALATLRFRGLLELHDLSLEVADVLEALVDRREAEVRDGIKGAEVLEHRQAEEPALDRRTRAPGPLLDIVGDDPGGVGRHRPSRDRELDAGLELGAVERHELARALPDQERGLLVALVGREPLTTGEALPPAPNRGALVGRPRVDHLVVIDPAVRTAHAAPVVTSIPHRRR